MSVGFDNPEYPSAPAPLTTDTLVDSVLILLGLTVVQRLIGFVRAVLFCRWLDPGQLGLWDMAFSFLVLAAPLSVLAIPGVFGRYLERYRAARSTTPLSATDHPGLRPAGDSRRRRHPLGATFVLDASLRVR